MKKDKIFLAAAAEMKLIFSNKNSEKIRYKMLRTVSKSYRTLSMQKNQYFPKL
jgi:hypothetical protein